MLRLKRVTAIVVSITLILGNFFIEKREVKAESVSDFTYGILNDEVQITGYIGNASQIEIPNVIGGLQVTSIGINAFLECRGLRRITISDSVTSIGKSAFSGCSGLTSITIPEGVTSIGDNVFKGCSSLTSITIPEGVKST